MFFNSEAGTKSPVSNKNPLVFKIQVNYLFLEPFFEGHGGYTHAYNLCKYLRKFVHINFFSPTYSENKPLPGFIQRLWKIFIVQFSFIRKSKHADLIYVRGHFLSFLVVLWAYIKKKKIIFEINGPIEDALVHWSFFNFLRPIVKFFIFQQVRLSDVIIVVTPQLKEYILSNVSYLKRNIHIIPNASDHELFNTTIAQDEDIPQPYAIFFGSLTKWQGIDLLLSAAICSHWPKKMKLVIVGNGPQSSLVKKFSNMYPHIIYLKKQPYAKLPSLIANSFCSIIPKNNLCDRQATGLSPIKFYESLACGAPLIVTDLPFMSDMVRLYELGIVVPLEEPEPIALAIQFFIDNPEIRLIMSQNARRFIVEENTWQHRAKQTFEIMEKLILKEWTT